MAFDSASFIANIGVSYLLGRLTAQDGPRLTNKEASGGDYGIPKARAYGGAVRITGAFIAQDTIHEKKHKVQDHSEIAGAITGAAISVQLGGGPIPGAVIGAVIGHFMPNQHYYTYSNSFDLFLLDRTNDDPIEGVTKLWANGKKIFDAAQADLVSETFDGDGKLIWRKYGRNKYFTSLSIYAGHTNQPVDAKMAEELNEDGAYPFSAHIVISDLQLAPFGNSVPPVEALISISSTQTLADTAEAICAAAGIDYLREISSTSLVNRTLRGYSITAEATCWDALKPLLPIFAVDAAEVSGQIRFYRRSQSLRATIPANDMGAYIYGDSPPNKRTFRRGNDLSLPRETSLTFVDLDRDYQPNTATSKRSEGSAASNVNVSVQVVLQASEGASAAALMHWDAWLGRTQLSFTLTDAWIGIETGLAYAMGFANQYVPYRITRKLRGANGIIEVEALSDESVTYTASVLGSSGTVPDDESTLFPDTRLIIMDMPILEDAHDDYGFHISMIPTDPGWTRGRIEGSSSGTTWATLVDWPSSAIGGDVTGTLAAGTTDGLDDTLDTTTVLTVVLEHDLMELESTTDTELDAYANFAYVGKDGLGEYLQFKTATKIAAATWELTNLRRGRRGTDHAIATHASGEEFVLLSEPGAYYRISYADPGQWGDALHLRGVTLHQDVVDAEEQVFTNTGEGKRPFSPVNVEGAWDGSNNLTITWDSRSRLFAGGLGIDDNAEWDIEIISGAGRSDTVVAETFVYSAADQITDGILPGDSIQGRVRQTSDVNDGRWRNFLLIGPDDTWELEDDLTPYHLEDDVTPLELEA